MTIYGRCAYCGGEPMTVGFAHNFGCPVIFDNGAGPVATQPLQILAPPVIPFNAAMAIHKLRRKLKCVLSEYRMLGTLEPEILESIEQVLNETEVDA